MTIRSGEISRMRSTVQAHAPATCTVQRATRTTDGAGGYTEAYANLAGHVDLACRIYHKSVRVTVAGEQTVAERRPYVELPYDATVQLRDHIVSGGRTFEVIAPAPQPEGITLTVECVEIYP